MSTVVLAKKREVTQHSKLSEMRKGGFVPAIVYGYQTESTPIAISEKDFIKTIRKVGRNGVMTLDVEGNTVQVVLNDYQMNVINGEMIHADFLAINMSEELEVNVPVTIIGEAEGVKLGGVLQQPNFEVTIKVKPSNIPEVFELDVSNMVIGDALSVGEIRDQSTFEIVNDDDFTLATVTAPSVGEEAEDEGNEVSEDQESNTNE